VNKKQLKRGLYSVEIVESKIDNFKKWLIRFHGVATKYLQSYLMWFVVMNKYLKDMIDPDIGRLPKLVITRQMGVGQVLEINEIKI